jgi:hypothetical protein
MNLFASLDSINNLVDYCETLSRHLTILQEKVSDDDWDVFCDNEHLDELLSTCGDIQAIIQEES